tara:strand:+ start:40 stop:210 length:171 start_codon:yes stop_codon:yes gene_type:complete
MKFITLKKVGKFTYEFVKSGNNKYDIIMFKNDSIINQITINKEMMKDMLNFIKNNK